MSEKKPQLHFSALNMFARCGEQFRRRYVEGEILPPGVALVVGSATDRSVNENLGHKIRTQQLLEEERVAAIARDALEAEWETKGIKLDEEERQKGMKAVKGEAADKAVRLSVLHHRDRAPIIQPTHVQRGWVVELQGYPMDLAGTIDIQEGAVAVRDTKTSKKSPPRDVAETSDQLTMYAMAARVIDGRVPERVALDYLIDNKTPVAKSFESERTEADFPYLLRRVENAIEAIERGVFVPVNQDHWICAQKWCGFWETCPYSRKPKSVALTNLEVS